MKKSAEFSSVDKKLKENNSEAFFVADKNPKTVNLNNFSPLLKNQKNNSPALFSVGKKQKEVILQHFAALIRNQKEVILQQFSALM